MPGSSTAVAVDPATGIPSKMSKLSLYPTNFSSEEVLLHAEDFPWLSVGDVIEVFAADEDGSAPRLLLKVKGCFACASLTQFCVHCFFCKHHKCVRLICTHFSQ